MIIKGSRYCSKRIVACSSACIIGLPFKKICVFEISDNATPTFLWWLAIPFGFLMVFFVTPLVRPLSWQQLVFTYLVPIIPRFIAWDGAVSNARTYSVQDLQQLTFDLQSETYSWEIGTIKGKGENKLYLLGLPTVKA